MNLIIGGGPTGMTLAWCLAQHSLRSTIVERNSVLGGCHRVDRQNGLFSEHGPRIYITNYLNFQSLLSEMGFSWEDFFIPYKYSYGDSGLDLSHNLTKRELFWLVQAHLKRLWSDEWARKITMKQFIRKFRFSKKASEVIDSFCRLTDGAGIDRYTLFEFTQLLNQNIFYRIYQPKKANDNGLIKKWQQALKKTGLVDILTDTTVTRINVRKNQVHEVEVFTIAVLITDRLYTILHH